MANKLMGFHTLICKMPSDNKPPNINPRAYIIKLRSQEQIKFIVFILFSISCYNVMFLKALLAYGINIKDKDLRKLFISQHNSLFIVSSCCGLI